MRIGIGLVIVRSDASSSWPGSSRPSTSWLSFHVFCKPVGGEVDADLAVVDVGVLGAALLGAENLDGLVGRTDRVVEFLRVLDRHDAVIASVRHQERAGDVL